MKYRWSVLTARFTAVAVVALTTTPAMAQGSRTTWGAPDLQGVWDFRSLTPMERPRQLGDQAVFTAEQAAEFSADTIRRRSRDSDTSDRAARAAQGDIIPYNDFWFDEGTTVTTERTSLIVDPPDGRMPRLAPEAERARAARRAAFNAAGPGAAGARWADQLGDTVRCTRSFNAGPPMRPSAYNNNMQLFQTPDYVVILNEMIHEARIVALDERSRPSPEVRLWTGSSRGHWEGDTLVVETTNLRPGAFRGSTSDLMLTERFTRTDLDTLEYEVTVEDPKTWSRPWTFVVPMARNEGEIYEYACHEGNYSMYNMLAGALAQEQ